MRSLCLTHLLVSYFWIQKSGLQYEICCEHDIRCWHYELCQERTRDLWIGFYLQFRDLCARGYFAEFDVPYGGFIDQKQADFDGTLPLTQPTGPGRSNRRSNRLRRLKTLESRFSLRLSPDL